MNKQDCYQVEYVNAWEAVVPPASIPSGAEHLVMQTGGNLVVYSASNRPLWNTGTATGKRSYLVVYAPPALIVSLVNGGPVWRWN